MLPKSRRISRREFPNLQFKGKTLVSNHFMVKIAPSETARFAVSVSKKVAKKATIRNRTRRRVYAVLKEILPSFKTGLHLFVAKAGAEKLETSEIRNEINKLL